MKELFSPSIALSDPRRVAFVDLAKGVCILLVVLLHMGIDTPMGDQMRMPLYFVLSGIFFKDYGVKLTIVKKVNKLLVPFMVFNLIGAVYYYFEVKYLTLDEPSFDFLKLITLRKATGVIWFLLSLFWDNMIFMILYQISKKLTFIGTAVLVLTALGYYLTGIDFNEMHITSSLLSLPFFFMGYLLKRTPLLTNTQTVNQRIISIVLGCACFALCFAYASYIDRGEIGFVNIEFHSAYFFTPYILGAMSVLGIMLICRGIVWLPILYFMGRYSIIILCVHIFYVNFFTHLRQAFFGNSAVHVAITVAIVLGLSIISIYFLRRYLPWICAQKDILVLRDGCVKLNRN